MAEVTLERAMGVAWEHVVAGRWGPAEGIYRQLLGQNPRLVQAMAGLARVLSQTGREKEGLEMLRGAAEISPKDAGLANHVGIAYVRQGRMEEAVPWFEKAVALEPGDGQAHYNLSKVLKDV